MRRLTAQVSESLFRLAEADGVPNPYKEVAALTATINRIVEEARVDWKAYDNTID